jgi:hypothetical protein
MTIHLTGMNNRNELNLNGKSDMMVSSSTKINHLKKFILSNYIIPLYAEQWDIIDNNRLLIDQTINQINTYYKLYKLEELTIYLELLKVLKILIEKNTLLNELKDKPKQLYDKNNIISLVHKITKIRILPEYELYNSIIGKPTKQNPYNEYIVNDIKLLMARPNITYDIISEYILKKYNT